MIKRIIDISEKAYVHLEHRQLLIDKEGETVGRIPVEDLGVLILEHPAIVLTQSSIIACQNNNVALIFCNEKHLPFSVLLPICEGNSLHSKVLQQQITIKLPTKKRLWQQIVKEKIGQQALTLSMVGQNSKRIDRLKEKVKSGDIENCEAQAAQIYWRMLFGDKFRRNQEANDINHLLNYGYAIVRAMVARALVGAGLHPALGLHHQNQYNGLCLADDLMEPFRPWVDYLVYTLASEKNEISIDRETKQSLIGLLSEQVIWSDKSLPLMVSCHYLMANLKRAYTDSSVTLRYPRLVTRLPE